MEYEHYSSYSDINKDKEDGVFNLRAALTGSLPGDKPLLEELGIDINVILKESQLSFSPFSGRKSTYTFLEKPDLSGPIVLLFFYSVILVLNRKLHFGYIYFLSIASVALMYFFFNVMGENPLSLIQCASVMGYCMGPILIFGILNLILYSYRVRLVISLIFSVWAAVASTKVLTGYLQMRKKYILLLYPMVLVYFSFCCLAIL